MVQERLLDIAVREFGAKGLDGVSTRDLAAAAGTAMSSITYHYGGKEGLYLAAADHIAEQMCQQIAPSLSAPIADDDHAAARAALHALLDHFANKMIADRDTHWTLFLMREQTRPTEAFDRLYRSPMGQMAERLVTLVRIATHVDERTARIVAVTLFGQAIVWRVSRALATRLLGEPLDDGAREPICRQITFNTDAILDRLIAERQEPQ